MIPGILLAVLLALGMITAPAAEAALIGLEPVSGIQLAAEPSESLCSWYKAGLRGMTLVQMAARPSIDSPRLDPPADSERLRAVLDRESCEDVRERTGFHLRQDAFCDTDNFILPAFQLGVVRELWWVIPTRQSISPEEFERFKEWLRGAFSLPEEFVDSLRQDGREMRGVYRGLGVHAVTLGDLPAFKEPVLVAIDAEYFTRIYDNPAKEAMLSILAGFFATLRDRKLDSDHVVVSSSVLSGQVPAAFAYLGSWLRDYLAAPDRFREGPPETWVMQSRTERLDFMLARDQALEVAESLAGKAPGSAAPWFFRAQVSASRGEADDTKEFMAEAVRRDPEYRAGYVALAAAFEEQQKHEESRALLEDGRARFPDDLTLGLTLINVYLSQGLPAEAATLAGELGRRRPGYPATAAARALALRASGIADAAEEAMAAFRGSAPEGGVRRLVLSAWETLSGPEAPPGNRPDPTTDTPSDPAPRQP